MSAFDDYVKWMSGGNDLSRLSTGDRSALDLNAIGGGLSAGLEGVAAGSKIASGFAGLDAAKYVSAQLRQNAGQTVAAGQRQAFDVDRQTQMIQSRALAVAAASGGGASDPGVVSIMAQTAAEGAYRKAMALFNAEDKAQGMESQADSAMYEGKVAKNNAIVSGVLQTGQAGTSLMRTRAQGKSLYDRFSGGLGKSEWTGEH